VYANPTMAVRGPHHGDLGSNVLKPNDKIHPTSFYLRLTLELHTKLDKERFCSIEVIDHNENIVHPLKRDIPSSYP
jgi:hypothetical protein